MIGKATSLLLTIAFAVAAILYNTSFKTKALEEDLARTNREIVAEYDKIQVLKAEWALLNDPERIERLAKTHLSLRPADPRQFAEVAALPTRRGDEAPTPVAVQPAAAAVVIDGRATQILLPAVKPAVQTAAELPTAPKATDDKPVQTATETTTKRPTPGKMMIAQAPSERSREDDLGSMIARLDLDRRTTR